MTGPRRRSSRYVARPSVVVSGRWVIHDADTKLCVRARSTIRLFDSEAAAGAVAEQMNTALIVCRNCRHKALLAECDHKVCERCRG
jgi:hypothetical protein